MKLRAAWWAPVVAACVPGPYIYDISPEGMTGAHAGDSESGLVYALAGGPDELWAVSINASVWKSHAGGRWRQLPGSPPFATSIAVDPRDQLHVAVGERNGDAKTMLLDHTGVWEGAPNGSFAFVFNPRWVPGCRATGDASVPAVLFDGAGDLFVATSCGVYRRPVGAGATAFVTDPATPAIGKITALALSRTERGERIWARGARQLAFSDDRGATWQAVVIPAKVDGFGTQQWSRGDDFAIAARGTTAAMLFVADSTTDSTARTAQECDPQHPGSNHKLTILYYVQSANRFQVQVVPACDGTGLGGRRVIKSMLPGGQTPLGGARIYVSAAQDLLEATAVNADQTWTFTAVPTAGLHSDFWDLAVTPSNQLSLATDGGVFDLAGKAWVHRNAGLHNHHIHTLTALSTSAEPRFLYSTSDNDSWERAGGAFRDPPVWLPENICGDTNMTGGDIGLSTTAVHWRHGECGQTTDFAKVRNRIAVACTPTLNGAGQPACTDAVPGALQLAFIQTRAAEVPNPQLDAVALVTLPLRYVANGAIVNGPGELGTRTGPALIRNQAWLANADTRTGLAGWELVAPGTALPPNTTGMVVAGSHQTPVYFAIATTAGHGELWHLGPAGWHQLDVGGTLLASDATYGTVFVNPFDPKHIFAVASDGVRVSVDGQTFVRDDTLTALVTASGKYPLSGNIASNGRGVVMASRANWVSVISQIAFNRAKPHQVLVGAPFTGAFYAEDDQRRWRDVGRAIPRAGAHVSSVALDDRGGYLATEGRGLFAAVAVGDARRAALFQRSTTTAAGIVGRLVRSDGPPVTGTAVDVIVLGASGPEVAVQVTTDSNGNVTVPSVFALTNTTVYLAKPLTKDSGGAEATFQY